MTPEVKGLHHFTAISGEPTQNARFYVNILGLRMVKKTVNHDAPQMYHLFYGDEKGTPGSSITFFPMMTDREGKPGAGMVAELGLRIPEESLDYWQERLREKDIEHETEEWRGRETLSFTDSDGLALRLVPGESSDYSTWSGSSVPEEHQIQGMHHVRLTLHDSGDTARLLETMNLEEQEDGENRYFRAEDGSGVEIEESGEHGVMGRGSVHHVAFKVEDEEEQEKWREVLTRSGMRPSPLISRKYFSSIYFQTPGGVLFEFSTMGPGYTADESVEELGSSLVLPENLEPHRAEIENALPEFNEEEIH